MFIKILLSLAFTFSSTAGAHCPNAFSFDEKNLCVDLKWEMAKIQKGEGLMSPVLNKENPLPFETYLSSVWVQIWEQGDLDPTLIFPEGLTVAPYMTMLNGMHHGAFSSLALNDSKGIQLSEMKFNKMEGCWYITLQGEGLFHMIKILNYTNLSDGENFEQQMYCEVCTSDGPKPDNGGSHNHSQGDL